MEFSWTVPKRQSQKWLHVLQLYLRASPSQTAQQHYLDDHEGTLLLTTHSLDGRQRDLTRVIVVHFHQQVRVVASTGNGHGIRVLNYPIRVHPLKTANV